MKSRTLPTTEGYATLGGRCPTTGYACSYPGRLHHGRRPGAGGRIDVKIESAKDQIQSRMAGYVTREITHKRRNSKYSGGENSSSNKEY
jgi:hypothetical protein